MEIYKDYDSSRYYKRNAKIIYRRYISDRSTQWSLSNALSFTSLEQMKKYIADEWVRGGFDVGPSQVILDDYSNPYKPSMRVWKDEYPIYVRPRSWSEETQLAGFWTYARDRMDFVDGFRRD